MKGVELYAQVRYAVQIEGLSRREAARRYGIDPRTVAKMLAFSVPPGYRRRLNTSIGSDAPSNAPRYREQAGRIRRDAERITDEKTRLQMLDVAAQYDRLADALEGEPR